MSDSSNLGLYLVILVLIIFAVIVLFLLFKSKKSDKNKKEIMDMQDKTITQINEQNELLDIENKKLEEKTVRFDYGRTGDIGETIVMRLINEWSLIDDATKKEFIIANPYVYKLMKIIEKVKPKKDQQIGVHVGENKSLHYDIDLRGIALEVKTSVGKNSLNFTNAEFLKAKEMKDKYHIFVITDLSTKYDLEQIKEISVEEFFEFLTEGNLNLYFLNWRILFNPTDGIKLTVKSYSIAFVTYFNNWKKNDPEYKIITNGQWSDLGELELSINSEKEGLKVDALAQNQPQIEA